VAFVAVAHTVLPVTARVALGKGLTLTAAVSVKFTVAQPPIEDLTLIVFHPEANVAIGMFKVRAPPVLVTGLPILFELNTA
jgi:hypothetical protein